MHTLIGEKLKNKITGNVTYNYFITQMLLAGITYDELCFDKLFGSCLQRFGPERYIRNNYLSYARTHGYDVDKCYILPAHISQVSLHYYLL